MLLKVKIRSSAHLPWLCREKVPPIYQTTECLMPQDSRLWINLLQCLKMRAQTQYVPCPSSCGVTQPVYPVPGMSYASMPLYAHHNIVRVYISKCRSQWPRGLTCGSAAACSLGLQVQISPRLWRSVSYGCCVLYGRGLCDGWSLFQRSPTEYGVTECDRGLPYRKPRPTMSVKVFYIYIYTHRVYMCVCVCVYGNPGGLAA